MIPSKDEEVLGVLDLVRKEQADGLERLLATINVVAEEEVVGFWGEAAVLEESKEIVVLAVDVAANLAEAQSQKSVHTKGSRQEAIGYPKSCSLPTHVRTHLDRSLELQKYRLGNEDLTGLGAEIADFSLEELNLLTGPAASDFEQTIDYRIKIDLMLVCHLDVD